MDLWMSLCLFWSSFLSSFLCVFALIPSLLSSFLLFCYCNCLIESFGVFHQFHGVIYECDISQQILHFHSSWSCFLSQYFSFLIILPAFWKIMLYHFFSIPTVAVCGLFVLSNRYRYCLRLQCPARTVWRHIPAPRRSPARISRSWGRYAKS